jgi:ATP-independent RNA helicase DbpA
VSIYTETEIEKAQLYKDEKRKFLELQEYPELSDFEMKPEFCTVVIEGGKKDKVRKGDLLGSLVKDVGIDAKNIGKIDIYDKQSYVAVSLELIEKLPKNIVIKKKRFPSWIL